jgi:hypothetical protein
VLAATCLTTIHASLAKSVVSIRISANATRKPNRRPGKPHIRHTTNFLSELGSFGHPDRRRVQETKLDRLSDGEDWIVLRGAFWGGVMGATYVAFELLGHGSANQLSFQNSELIRAAIGLAAAALAALAIVNYHRG